MPRFFIDVNDGNDLYYDEEGSVLEDLEHAQREAGRILFELVQLDCLIHGPFRLRATVRSGAGEVLLNVTLRVSVDLSVLLAS